MADIKSYMKEKEKRERRQADYKNKIRKHRLTNVYRILLVLAAAAALLALIFLQYKRHIYTEYEVISSVPRNAVEGTTDYRLGNHILTYSKDGAHCTDIKGNVMWNQTYGIQDVKMATCEDTVALAEYNGRKIYVQNTSGKVSEITTTMPIRNLAVSSSGYVTAVLEDKDKALIHTYNADGELKFQGQARMNDSGYPAALSLSPNGELLCIAYWYLDAGVIKTNVAFYNLGPVGSNKNDSIVSAYTYSDMLVPQVGFLDNETPFAVGDSSLIIFKGAHIPANPTQYYFDQEIKSVFYGNKYIGLVFRSEEEDVLYRMDVYDNKAAKVGSFPINIEYTDILFCQDTFVAYSERDCVVMNMEGTTKYSGTFPSPVRLMLPIGNTYKYLLVTDSSLDTIQLK